MLLFDDDDVGYNDDVGVGDAVNEGINDDGDDDGVDVDVDDNDGRE